MDSSLNIAYKELRSRVGVYFGYRRGDDFGDPEWSDDQTRNIEQCLKSGLRRFYFCGRHQWSFLKPLATITIDSGSNETLLPADFGSPDGPIILSTDGEQYAWQLPLRGIGQVLFLRQQDTAMTGRPSICAILPIRERGSNEGQRWKLEYSPVPDQDYTAKMRYNLNPEYLSGSKPYAYGGPQHAETILAACKATAELDFDDIQNGPQFTEFMRLMGVSIDIDGRNKPDSLGLNLDRSDYPNWRNGRSWREGIVTFNGTVPD